jgi:hypothetical protein
MLRARRPAAWCRRARGSGADVDGLAPHRFEQERQIVRRTARHHPARKLAGEVDLHAIDSVRTPPLVDRRQVPAAVHEPHAHHAEPFARPASRVGAKANPADLSAQSVRHAQRVVTVGDHRQVQPLIDQELALIAGQHLALDHARAQRTSVLVVEQHRRDRLRRGLEFTFGQQIDERRGLLSIDVDPGSASDMPIAGGSTDDESSEQQPGSHDDLRPRRMQPPCRRRSRHTCEAQKNSRIKPSRESAPNFSRMRDW